MKKTDNIAVKVDGVSKHFKIPHEKRNSLKGAVLNIFNNKSYSVHRALSDIDFEVREGEFFGIVGRNGSGKSTLLKILAGIYVPDSGKVKIKGRLSPFLELGVGFNPELTARENIYLNGAILGMSKKEIDSKFDEIIRFSELEEFVDMKIKNFSSGMHVRLAFSVAIQAHSEVLLIDEVLAVGDAKFQEKCFHTFRELKASGKTIVFVTHDMGSVKTFCDRAMLIDDSKIDTIGSIEKVVQRYNEINGTTEVVTGSSTEEGRWGNFKIKIAEVALLSNENKKKNVFRTDESFSVKIKYNTKECVKNPNIGLAIFRDDGVYCFDTNTDLDGLKLKEISKDGEISIKYNKLPLQAGNYYFKIGIYKDYDKEVIDFIDNGPQFRVIGENQFGITKIDHEWSVNEHK